MSSSTRIDLWPNGAPGAMGDEEYDVPFLDAYVPQQGNGAAVVVCPGGGYAMLALDHEGQQVAEWLNERGFAAFVLHYRHAPHYKHPVPLRDAQRALRVVRSRAREWKIDDTKIGMWGFSAGGHLTASCATLWDEGQVGASDAIDQASCRPDFAVLAYPVISLVEEYTHIGSRDCLLKADYDPELAVQLSPEKQVNDLTPPTFLFHTAEDYGVPAMNSIAFYTSLLQHNVAGELHIYEHGPHGVGLAQDDEVLSTWTTCLHHWLKGVAGV